MRGRKLAKAGGLAVAAAAGLVAVQVALESRLVAPTQAFDGAWDRLPIRRRGRTMLGISFRPRQVEAFGLDPDATFEALLAYPFDVVRVAAYWNRVEPEPGVFDTGELDRQLDAIERADRKVILGVGGVKNFGYPEFFVPGHRLAQPIKEGSLVTPNTHPGLLAATTEFIQRIVERYRDRPSIVAWQLEHEAVDPLGVEHSWRLDAGFVQRELDALRDADPSRPVMMNGFLPTSTVVRLSQWWRTKDQGDSLAVATRMADIVGVDHYPRHALLGVGTRTLYMDGGALRWQRALARRVAQRVHRAGKRLMVSEGQAEPWEAVTLPPNPSGGAMFSCRPQDVIRNYNTAMEWSAYGDSLYAYLFWGAEYWVLRSHSGDHSYLRAVARIADEA